MLTNQRLLASTHSARQVVSKSQGLRPSLLAAKSDSLQLLKYFSRFQHVDGTLFLHSQNDKEPASYSNSLAPRIECSQSLHFRFWEEGGDQNDRKDHSSRPNKVIWFAVVVSVEFVIPQLLTRHNHSKTITYYGQW